MSIDANSIASAGLRGSSDNYLFSELETGHGEYFSNNKLVIPAIAGVINKGILVSRNGATTNLQLDFASETKLGGIKIGDGLQIDGTGVASVKDVHRTKIFETADLSIVPDDVVGLDNSGNVVKCIATINSVEMIGIVDSIPESGKVLVTLYGEVTVDPSSISSFGLGDIIFLSDSISGKFSNEPVTSG